jgi:hypothetical protein
VQNYDASADYRYAVILTWNPDEFDWGEGYLDAVRDSGEGFDVDITWSTGVRKSGVSEDDRVFMLRQGTHGRGIVASGYTVSEIYQERDWRDGSPGWANFVDVFLDRVVPVEDALSTEVLNEQIPEAKWDRRQASGTFLRGRLVGKLEALWRSHLAALAVR